MDRRGFLRTGLVATSGFVAFGSSFWRALASHAAPVPGPGPYGPLGAPDASGIRLPAGFSARVVARGDEIVPGTSYRWHWYPDGAATFATADGGWIYVSNSELDGRGGGASALRFAADGSTASAYRILERTRVNCAGGATPWGTWLSCEEIVDGLVWECDPTGSLPAVPRRALGSFKHEAAVTDPQTAFVYLTEDQGDGCFYRFRPDAGLLAPTGTFLDHVLEGGTLEVAKLAAPAGGAVEWLPVPQPNPIFANQSAVTPETRKQVAGATKFARGEGAWFDTAARTVYFATTSDHRIWAYAVDTQAIEVLFDGAATPGSPLRNPDNLIASASRDVFVCEDGDDLQMVLISREGEVAPFAQAVGGLHDGSELTGLAFSPAGDRLYVSSQRGGAFETGVVFEVRGPFRAAP